MKILIATQKPFSIDAVYGIQDILEGCEAMLAARL